MFGALHWVPTTCSAALVEVGVGPDYTTWLNLAFLALAGVRLSRFVRTRGIPMLRIRAGRHHSPSGTRDMNTTESGPTHSR